MHVTFRPWHVSTVMGLLLAVSLLTIGGLLNYYWWPYIDHGALLLWLNLVPGIMMLIMWLMAAIIPQDRHGIVVIGAAFTVVILGCAGFMNLAAMYVQNFAPGGQ